MVVQLSALRLFWMPRFSVCVVCCLCIILFTDFLVHISETKWSRCDNVLWYFFNDLIYNVECMAIRTTNQRVVRCGAVRCMVFGSTGNAFKLYEQPWIYCFIIKPRDLAMSSYSSACLVCVRAHEIEKDFSDFFLAFSVRVCSLWSSDTFQTHTHTHKYIFTRELQ